MNYNNNQNNILLNKVLNFYTLENTNTFIDIIENKYNISLRLIDWFVTIYCKNKHVQYPLNNNIFNVYQSYKLMGKSYKKRKFDPFCRGDRIFINHNNHEFETTIGQLNFFKWAISNNIVNYISEYKELLNNEMTEYIKEKNAKKNIKKLKINAEKNIHEKNIEIVVSFN